jgi:hypothetical protein
MATIPMMTQVPNMLNPLDVQARAEQIRGAQADNALAPYRLQQAKQGVASGAITLEQQQRALQEQKDLEESMRNNSMPLGPQEMPKANAIMPQAAGLPGANNALTAGVFPSLGAGEAPAVNPLAKVNAGKAALDPTTAPNAFGVPGVNWNGVIRDMASKGHNAAAMAISKNLFEFNKQNLEMHEKQLEGVKKKADMAASLLSTVKDPTSLQRALDVGAQNGLVSPQDYQRLRQQGYTAATIQELDQMTQSVVTAQQKIENERANAAFLHQQATLNHQIDKERPATTAGWLAFAGQVMGIAKTPEQLEAGWQNFIGNKPPEEVVAIVKQAKESGGAEAVTELAQTVEQRERGAGRNPTDTSLAAKATYDPTKTPQQNAEAALKRADQSKREGRSVNITSGATSTDAADIADAIVSGNQPPDMKGLYRFGGPVKAALARRGYDLVTAQKDWQAVQRHIATLNGPQQERLRQAVTFTYDSLDNIESLYNEWLSIGPSGGLKSFNKAALAVAKNLPGRAGAVATSLEAQISDLTSELGTVYKGGNASTDESLRLAANNLKADWNEQAFKFALTNIRKNLNIRKNSIMTSEAVGTSENSRYVSKPALNGGVSGTGKAKDPLGILP